MPNLVTRLTEGASKDLPALREEAAGRIMATEMCLIMIEGIINQASADHIADPERALTRIQELLRIVIPDAPQHIRQKPVQ